MGKFIMEQQKDRSGVCNNTNNNKSNGKVTAQACSSKNNQKSKNKLDTSYGGNTSKCGSNYHSNNGSGCGLKTRLRSAFRTGRCHKPQYRNPFFNFLRDYRRRNTNLTVTEIAKRGAKEWNVLPGEAKQPYIQEASTAPKVRRRRRRIWRCTHLDSAMDCGCSQRKRRRPRSKCRPKTRSRARSRRRSSKCPPKNPCRPLCGRKRRRKKNKCGPLCGRKRRTCSCSSSH